jgi:hypothetical protein
MRQCDDRLLLDFRLFPLANTGFQNGQDLLRPELLLGQPGDCFLADRAIVRVARQVEQRLRGGG